MGITTFPRHKTLSMCKTNVVQRLKNLLIIDFEATCEKDHLLDPQEIIEFPCVVMKTENWKVDKVFHSYVKPRINPILTTYCTDLTGIMQETVDDEEHFPEVLKKFQQWLETNGYLENFHDHSAFVACGDWDLRVMLPDQCALDGLAIPDYFQQWINLKRTFFEVTGYYPSSIRKMLQRLDLELEGRLHSGLNDSMNMAKIIEALPKVNPLKFHITSRNEKIMKNK